MFSRFLPRSLRLRVKVFKKSLKLAIKIYWRETFSDNPIRRGLSMIIALIAVVNFLTSIFFSPYDSFSLSIPLLLIAFGLGATESECD